MCILGMIDDVMNFLTQINLGDDLKCLFMLILIIAADVHLSIQNVSNWMAQPPHRNIFVRYTVKICGLACEQPKNIFGFE